MPKLLRSIEEVPSLVLFRGSATMKTRQHNFQCITTMTISMPMIPMLTTDVTDVKIMSELMFYLFLVLWYLEPNVDVGYR